MTPRLRNFEESVNLYGYMTRFLGVFAQVRLIGGLTGEGGLESRYVPQIKSYLKARSWV